MQQSTKPALISSSYGLSNQTDSNLFRTWQGTDLSPLDGFFHSSYDVMPHAHLSNYRRIRREVHSLLNRDYYHYLHLLLSRVFCFDF